MIGEIILVYEDYQEELNPLGRALVLEEKGDGLNFILEDSIKATEQIEYGTKKLLVEFQGDENDYYTKGYQKTISKRYIFSIGENPTQTEEDITEEELDGIEQLIEVIEADRAYTAEDYTKIDKFLKVDDIEMY